MYINEIVWIIQYGLPYKLYDIYIYMYKYLHIYMYIYVYINVQCLYLNISIENNIKSLLPMHHWMESKRLSQDITRYFLTEFDADINFESFDFIFIYTY